jgi:hypothetical protein
MYLSRKERGFRVAGASLIAEIEIWVSTVSVSQGPAIEGKLAWVATKKRSAEIGDIQELWRHRHWHQPEHRIAGCRCLRIIEMPEMQEFSQDNRKLQGCIYR